MRVLLALLLTFIISVAITAAAWLVWQKYGAAPQEPVPELLPIKAESPTMDTTVPQTSPAEPAKPTTPLQSRPAPKIDTKETDISIPSPEEETAGDILQRAMAALEAGRYRDALRDFELALPHTSSALAGIGVTYYKLEDYNRATRYLERSLRERGNDPVVLKFLALAYYRQDDLEKSASYAERSLAMHPDEELMAFYQRLSRERHVTRNRVDEANLHFKVIFDGYEHGSISRLILNILDDAYREIGREFGHFPDHLITVILYTEKDFADVTLMPSYVEGLYDGKIRLPVRGAENVDRKLLREVLYHEYVHAMVHDITEWAPQWIHEGLAEYLVPRGLDEVGQVIPLQQLERSFPLGDQRLVWVAYQESYSAVKYLVERFSLYDVKQLLIGLGRGDAVEDAFFSAFYLPYNDFLNTWGRD